MRGRPRPAWGSRAALAWLIAAVLASDPAVAQPARAGDDFHRFVVVSPSGTPIAFHHVARDSGAAAALARTAAAFAPRPVVGLPSARDSFDVVIAPGEGAFRELTGGRSPDWGLAVAFPSLRRVVMRSPRLTGTTGVDPAVVLRHELNHLYLAAAAGPGAGEIPRWFNEGFAALYADEWRWVAPYRLAWARITGTLPPLESLHATFPESPPPDLAYIESMAAVRSLQERGGDEGMRLLLERLRGGATFDAALRETFGLTLDQFYARWEEELSGEYGWLVALSDERGLWVLLAVAVAVLWIWRRRSVRREIESRKRREDAALGEPDDHSLGVEEQERYWEWDDEAWRGDEDDDSF